MRWSPARNPSRRVSRSLILHHSMASPERLEDRSLAGVLVAGPVGGLLTKPKTTNVDLINLFQNHSSPYQLSQEYLNFAFNPMAAHSYATPPPSTAPSSPSSYGPSSVSTIVTITPVFNASASSSPYMPYHSSANLNPLYVDLAIPAGPGINISTINNTYNKGPSLPVSITAAHGTWHNTTKTSDGQGSATGPLPSMEIKVFDTVSLEQDVGSFKYLNLASSSHVDHLIYDLRVIGPDFEDFGTVTSPVGYSGALILSCNPGEDWVGGLSLSADGVLVTGTGSGVSITYSTGTGTSTYTDSDFYLTGGTISIGFSGINTKGFNDVTYAWENNLELDGAPAGTGDSSQLDWNYSITY